LGIVILMIFSLTASGQSKEEYLKENRYDLRNNKFEFLQRDFKIIGFGAVHGSAKTEDAEFLLLKTLMKRKAIKYYLPETDIGIAYYLNTYLKTGDTLLLKDLVYHYGERVPQEKSVETYNKWKRIKQLNDTLQPDNKLAVVGIDCIVTYKYISKYLLELFSETGVKTKPMVKLTDMIQTDSTDFSPYYNSYSKQVLQELITDIRSKPGLYDSSIKDKQLVDYILSNIEISFKSEWRDRERIIFDNYLSLSKLYNFNIKPQFARFGFSHLEKSSEGNYPSFFAMLVENEIYSRNEVVTVMGYLTKSRVLWDVFYDKLGNYKGYSTKGGYGIGDYWKERFKGIKLLKKAKLSDLTLFRLNQKNTPYNNGEADFIEVELFFKKSNRHLIKGKSTVDFIDYAVLISDSPANKAIQEIK